MRTLGLLGGMAWPSTAEAYRLLNQQIAERLGGAHSARLLIWSADFAEIEQLQSSGHWDQAGQVLADAARRLEVAGAEGLLLCTNTMHRVAEVIEAAVGIPLLHIADATGERAVADGRRRVGLLGTRFTMEETFYRDRLAGHGLDVLVPEAADRELVHRVIYDELVHGMVNDRSRARYISIAERLVGDGAEAIIAGCTEIELLLRPQDLPVELYPTTRLHVSAAADWMLADDAVT
ncbi:aspartate/glutamate racemase family protein [Nitriliruptor alkaliphilus]|uniref:aspartate/glutamate racemase family protein n=1 Tax=Nitriliruptor alkaliphilus TaxID=427918 RepID=UPI000697243F|nr:aspartate/glutamate racemase family protein [Nitriliruptor alkaliphilus]